MIFRTRLKNPAVMMRVGMSFLLLGIVSFNFLRPSAGPSRDLVDAIAGLFYGIAIGSLLMSLRARRGRRSKPDAGPR